MKDVRAFRFARIGLAVAAFAAAMTAATPTVAQTSVKLTLDGRIEGPTTPFLLPLDRGYYRAEGLEVTVDQASGPLEAITRVAGGAYEFGFADINTLIRYRDQHPDASITAVFMVHNKPALAVIGRKSRGIVKPKDLESKRLGAPAADPAYALWPLFAKLNDIDLSKVSVESVGMPVREPMLAAGQVDAITGYSFSSYVNLKDRGVPVDDLVALLMGDYGVKAYGNAIIVNTKFAAEKPEAVKALLRAFLKGLKDTIRDPTRSVDAVVKRDELAKKDLELERLRMAIRENFVTPEVKAQGFGAVDMERLNDSIEQIGQIVKFKAKPKATDVFDPSFLPPPPDRRTN
jgi:NitT/TauT family transport system substrate-binding protein